MFNVLNACIYVAPWSREARFVPLCVPTCSGKTIKLNLNLKFNLKVIIIKSIIIANKIIIVV